jgi:hypothetical protein
VFLPKIIYYIQKGFFELFVRDCAWKVLHARSAWICLEVDDYNAATLCLQLCMWFWRVFEATTMSGLRPLLAILAAVCDLRVGVALDVENFSGTALGVSTWIS